MKEEEARLAADRAAERRMERGSLAVDGSSEDIFRWQAKTQYVLRPGC